MDEIKSFNSTEQLENFLMEYMEEHNSEELYVYMRYGYTKEATKEEKFGIEISGGMIGMKDRIIVKFSQL